MIPQIEYTPDQIEPIDLKPTFDLEILAIRCVKLFLLDRRLKGEKVYSQKMQLQIIDLQI